jgi:acetyl esterase/lipase/cytochrome b561
MTQIEIKSDSVSSYFIQKHSVAIRVWHWLTFILLSATIITVLLNSTLMNQRTNIPVVQEVLKSKGVTVSEDQAFAVTREYEDKSWGVHKWIGFGLTFLLLSRIVIEITQPGEEKIRSRFKKAMGLYKQNDANKTEYRHYLGTKFSYLLFYVLLICMAITGLFLAFGSGLGISRELHGTIKEIHAFGQYLMYGFVFIHLCGIFISENQKARGIVSGMINGNKAVLLLILLISGFSVNAQGPGKPNTDNIKRKWLDVAYANKSQAQKLDIYLPDNGDGPFPVVLSIHGGAFKGGDKSDGQVTPMLEGLKRGYAVVSINYRLSGEAIWPAQIVDCKAAVRWIRANAKQYKLNPDKIAAWGGSAGGHLSAMIGTSGNVRELEDLSQGNSDQSSRVQAVVDWFGPTNFLKMDDDAKESKVVNPQIHSIPDSPESELIGKNLTDAPELVKMANPETYITKDDPPFFIQHGSVDPLVPFPQSVRLAEKLGEVIGKDNVTIELIAGSGHGGPAFSTPENLNKVFAFLDKILKADINQ